jgi:hypothetical protein
MENLALLETPFAFIVKIGILIFLFLYIIFSVAVSRQVKIMTESLEVGFETPIRTIAVLHLVAAVVVFFLALILL